MLRLSFEMVKKCVGYFAVFAITILFSTKAHAEGFSLYDWSARGAALASGLVARGGDASSLAYNPAAITKLEGIQIMVGAEFVLPTLTIDFPTESTDSKSTLFVVPNFYVTHKLNDSFSYGLAVFSRFGLGNAYDDNWAGRESIIDVELQAVTINPNIAYSLNEQLSFAAGLELTPATVHMNLGVGPAPSTQNLDISGNAFGVSYNLAVHYKFNDAWSAGLTYRSKMDLDFSGDVKSSSSALSAMFGTAGDASIKLPDQFAFGVAWQVIPELSLEADISYYVWSTYKELALEFDGPAGTVLHQKDWKDTYFFALSAEYDVLEWLTLRAGISYETSPLSDTYADYLAPTNGRFKYGIGAGYNKNDFTVDASYVFSDLNDIDYSNSIASGVSQASKAVDLYAHSFMINLGYKF